AGLRSRLPERDPWNPRPGCCTSTSARSRPVRSSPRACISAPDCSYEDVMAKSDRNWIPEETDLDWIESISAPVGDALAAIETAAKPLGIPIVDRDAGRVLCVVAGGRRRIIEIGTAYGYSTLWMALGQPADGTIVTI